MRQLTSLAWKEWREVRAYLWIGLGVFLGLPLIGGWEALHHTLRHFQIEVSPWVTYLGGVLAVFVAVGATCRDLSGRIEDFWRSRPVSVIGWLTVKYIVGMTVALMACLVPLVAEAWINKEDAHSSVIFYPFFWIATYSMAFAAGCLLRRTAHAAMLGLAAMLLVYLLPLVLPPLSWLNLADVGNGPWKVAFIYFPISMLGLAAMGALVSLLAVRNDWQIESGSKMIYALASCALLILCGSATFQLGTNLPVLQELTGPLMDHVQEIKWDDDGSYVGAWHGDGLGNFSDYHYYRLQATGSGIHIGDPIAGENSSVTSSIRRYDVESDQETLRLIRIRPTPIGGKPVFEPMGLQLWSPQDQKDSEGAFCSVWENRLYVITLHKAWAKQRPELASFWESIRLAGWRSSMLQTPSNQS